MAPERAQPRLQAKPLRAMLATLLTAVSAGSPLHEIVLLPFPRRARVH
jgi:hypothetical protein